MSLTVNGLREVINRPEVPGEAEVLLRVSVGSARYRTITYLTVKEVAFIDDTRVVEIRTEKITYQ